MRNYTGDQALKNAATHTSLRQLPNILGITEDLFKDIHIKRFLLLLYDILGRVVAV